MQRELPRLLGDITRQQSGSVSDRKSLLDNQEKAQQAAVGQPREDPVLEHADVMTEH